MKPSRQRNTWRRRRRWNSPTVGCRVLVVKTSSIVLSIVVLLATGVVVAQDSTEKLPAAVPAPDTRPQLCGAEPLETPLPQWKDGSLKAELVIGSDGAVHGIHALKNTYPEPDIPGIYKVLRKWRFKPTYYKGYYVNAKLMIELSSSKQELNIRFAETGCKDVPFPSM